MNALEELGLSDLETRVYLASLDRPSATAAEFVVGCGADEAAIARVLAVLQECGLVTRLAGTPAHYVAVRPELALGVLIRQREERLDRARTSMGALTERFRQSRRGNRSDEVIELVHSTEAIHQRWLHLQRSARREIRVLDKPPYIDAGNPAEPALLDEGVRYRTVYDRVTLDHPGKLAGIWEAAEAGEDCRVAGDVPIKLFLADDQVALAPLTSGPDLHSAVIVHRSALLDALGALFEAVWQRALPIAEFERRRDVGDVPLTEQQRRLLQLLASGCTDETTARHLDVGTRTVQRQIRGLMEAFGVRTRFQLGLRAAASLDHSSRCAH